MPRYVAFQVRYTDRLLSPDSKTCHLTEIGDCRIVLIREWSNGEYYFFDPCDKPRIESNLEYIPNGSIVFVRNDGNDNIEVKAPDIYDYLYRSEFCDVSARGDITEYEDLLVVECLAKNGQK